MGRSARYQFESAGRKPGGRAEALAPRFSLMTERIGGMDAARAPGGKPDSRESYGGQNDRRGDEGHRIARLDAVEKTREKTREAESGDLPDGHSDQRQAHAIEDDQISNTPRFRAERQPDADFPSALLNRPGDQSINADGGQRESKESEDAHERQIEILAGGGTGHDLIHRAHVHDG